MHRRNMTVLVMTAAQQRELGALVNPTQQREHGQAVARLHARIDTLAECVDAEVAEKMEEMRALVTSLLAAERALRKQDEQILEQTLVVYADLMDNDTRAEFNRQLEALSKRVAVFETMTWRGLLAWLRARVWRDAE